MERDAWNKQNRQKRFQGMGFPVKEPNEYACIVLKSLFCTSGWSLFLSVQLSVHNFPTESFIHPYFWVCWDSQGKVGEDRLALEIPPLLQEGQKERRGESPRALLWYPMQCVEVAVSGSRTRGFLTVPVCLHQ